VNARYPSPSSSISARSTSRSAVARVFVEYVMLAGVNDRYEQAQELARLLNPRFFKVNLIPYNPTGRFEGSSRKAIAAFRRALREHGLPATLRLTRGRDIEAACGQLAAARVTLFAFYGTFTSSQPGHGNLAGARLVERTRTAPKYRLFFVDELWPALVPFEDGVAIECELYECFEELLERLSLVEPPGWNRSPLELEDGRTVETFLGDAELAARGVDVSEHGSWAAFVSSRAPLRPPGSTPP
jgi:gamma-glutamylcyclotransferase (GGCT)/AIG2-like uncharacterized protein YtfP